MSQSHSPFERQVRSLPKDPIAEDVTVVVPTLGRSVLEFCLKSLAQGETKPARVVVVDQGRNPTAAAWMKCLTREGIVGHYIESNRLGRSAGINRGLEEVATRFVAITDDDCFVSRTWLSAMMALLRKEPGTVVTGRVEPAGDADVAFCVVTFQEAMRFERPQWRIHPFIGGNVGMSMEIIRRVGAFDEHSCVESAEDSDYGYRVLRLGVPIIYDPAVFVSHYQWRNAGQRAARYIEYARSQGGFYGKFLFDGGWLVPAQAARDLARGPIRWLRGLIRRDRDMADRGRADTMYLLPGIVAGVRRNWMR